MIKLNKIFGRKLADIKLSKYDFIYLIPALFIFTAISLWTITKTSIWFDEAFGAYLTRFDIFDIAKYTAMDVHPPLYYWFLKIWGLFFGYNELGLRSMSVFFGVVSIIFGYLLIKRLFNDKIARFSLIFMVFSPMFIRYAQEMRMYTMIAAIAVAATYFLVLAIESNKRKYWLAYGVLIGLGILTHYFTALIWVTHWIWRADNIRRESNKGKFIKEFFSKEWLIAHGLALLVTIAWLPSLIKQVLTVQLIGFWISPVNLDRITNLYSNTVYYMSTNEAVSWYAVGIVALVYMLIWLSTKSYRSLDAMHKQSYRLIMMLAFAPVAILFLVSLPPLRPTFIDRYLIPSMFFTYIFIGITLAYGAKIFKNKIYYLSVFFVLSLMIIGVSNVNYYGNYIKNANPPESNNTKEIYNAVVSKSDFYQPIIADTDTFFFNLVFYSNEKNAVYFINESMNYVYGYQEILKNNDQFKINNLIDFTKQHDIVWYVGAPRGQIDNFHAPYPNWVKIQEVIVNDSISGKPAYKAIQYQIK